MYITERRVEYFIPERSDIEILTTRGGGVLSITGGSNYYNCGNRLKVTRTKWWFIIPIRSKTIVFDTDNCIWLHNNIFGMGNQHNIDNAFKVFNL